MKKLLTLLIIVLLMSIPSILPDEGEEVNLKHYTVEEALELEIEDGRVVEWEDGTITIVVEVLE